MIVRGTDRVLVYGITGRQGTYWSEHMQACGTRIVAGVNPRKAGQVHMGVPVLANGAEAMCSVGFDHAVLFLPAASVKSAALEVIECGARGLVILTEHVPVQDVMYLLAAAAESGTRVVGPNTAGLVTPGACFVGFMPAFNPGIFCAGKVGVVSRSGSLGTLVCLNLVREGFGQSAFIGVGGDPVVGTTSADALETLAADPRTEAMVLVGEIGGAMEEQAAERIPSLGKPVVAFIAGAAAPPGRKMGHAGAIVTGTKGTHASKVRALEAAGALVAPTPSAVASELAEALAVNPRVRT